MQERLKFLKEKLLKELTPAEKWFFMKTAKEHIMQGYPPTENLFYYCYFLTLEYRLKELINFNNDAIARYTMAYAMADIKSSLKNYRNRIDSERQKAKRHQWCPPSEWPPAIT